jgi:hypothetical protein
MVDEGTTGRATGSTIPIQGHAGAESQTEQGTSATSSLSLPGLNIQWPFTQLILAGVKTIEVRTYELGHRNIAHPNREVWLVETISGSLKDATVPEGVDVPEKPPCAQIVGTITFSRSVPYDDRSDFNSTRNQHRIAVGGKHDWTDKSDRHAWHISSCKRLAAPIPCPGRKGMTGFQEPKSYPAIFLPDVSMAEASQIDIPPRLPANGSGGALSRRVTSKRSLTKGSSATEANEQRVAKSAKAHASSAAGSALNTSAAGLGVETSSGAPLRLPGGARIHQDISWWQERIQKFIDNRRAQGGQFQAAGSRSWNIHITAGDAERVRSAFDTPRVLADELAKLLRVVLCSGAELNAEAKAQCVREFQGMVHFRASQGTYKLQNALGAGRPEHADEIAEPVAAVPYFEPQVDGWCGMHALNHYFDGPYVDIGECRSAVTQFARKTGQRESDHLYPESGWLSIDIMNILAGIRGKHVEEGAREWQALRAEGAVAAMVNWNQTHWTVLKYDSVSQTWVHINSCLGPYRRHGRVEGLAVADVELLMAEIHRSAGGAALHRTPHPSICFCFVLHPPVWGS